jgi:glycosyltransferase involved in cell wall biosynthesis
VTAGSQPRPRPKITVFSYSYPPGYLAGGPARSVHALVEALADDFSFAVVTSALDGPAATCVMPSVKPDQWSAHGQARMWYESSARPSARTIARLLRDSEPDVIYLNSLFDYRFTLLPLIIAHLTSRRAVISLAPRGELAVGALALKPAKKQLFLAVFRLLALHRKVVWHASTDREKKDIEREVGPGIKSYVAIDLRHELLPRQTNDPGAEPQAAGHTGRSLVFFSRITPKKNLKTAIQAISLIPGEVRLSIAGPIEDADYWDECAEAIGELSDPGRVSYLGEIPGTDAVTFLGSFDLLVLPTRGENFGHVILESLAAGTPVIVGNDTPWQQIETVGAGWLCDPSSPRHVAALVERFLALPSPDRAEIRRSARRLAREILDDPRHVDANRRAFHRLAALAAGRKHRGK